MTAIELLKDGADFELPPPEVTQTIEISGKELRSALLQRGDSNIPASRDQEPIHFVKDLLQESSITVTGTRNLQQGFSTKYPGHNKFTWRPGDDQRCVIVRAVNGQLTFQARRSEHDDTGNIVFHIWKNNMFYFSAERMTVGESNAGHEVRLAPNASNLPAVLQTINGNRGDLFIKLVEHLREIFATVGNLSVRPVPGKGNTIEVRVWPTPAMENVELSFPLNSSGTGVSQVIAILSAVMTVDNSVVIIDEINSFLHPAAVKALLRILQTEYSQNQYIISTHSPDVIGHSNPRTLHLVKRDGYESSVQQLNLSEVGRFQEVAEHLGVSMVDVFGADRIIWVEGPTEELCFPLLYRQASGHPVPRGTIFTSVAATGDITRKRDRVLVFDIYRRLSTAAMPLVVKVGFSFDSETLSDEDKAQMQKESGGQMHFLPRRHIECYLLHPEAISVFIKHRDLEPDRNVTPEMVAARLHELAGKAPFKTEHWTGDIESEAWQSSVDAANLIVATCSDLSGKRVVFNKKDDTLFLLQSVQATHPQQTAGLASYVMTLVNAVAD